MTQESENEALWRLEIPYPPSINKRLSTLYKKSIYSRAAREHHFIRLQYKKEVWALFKQSKLTSFGKNMIKVNIEMFCPDKRHRDADGIIKELFDALQDAGCFEDDYQIKKYSVERKDEVIKNGKIIVEIEELN